MKIMKRVAMTVMALMLVLGTAGADTLSLNGTVEAGVTVARTTLTPFVQTVSRPAKRFVTDIVAVPGGAEVATASGWSRSQASRWAFSAASSSAACSSVCRRRRFGNNLLSRLGCRFIKQIIMCFGFGKNIIAYRCRRSFLLLICFCYLYNKENSKSYNNDSKQYNYSFKQYGKE